MSLRDIPHSHRPMHRIFRPVLLGLGAFFFLFQAHPAQALSKREMRKRYKQISRQIQQGYKNAIKLRYREPCEAYNAIPNYILWLRHLNELVPSQPLQRYHKRRIQRTIRSKERQSKRWLRTVQRRCEAYWRSEFKRQPPGKLSKRCIQRFPEENKGQELWVGVRPWAYVYVDGVLCGNAPLKLKLPPGDYQVRLDFPPSRDSHEQAIRAKQPPAKRSRRRSRRNRPLPPLLIVRRMKASPAAPKKRPNILSSQQIRWVLKRHKADLKSCQLYQPDTQQITLSWRITPQGKTEDIRWVSPADAHKRFRRCVLRAAMRWRFPKARANANIESYPISLQ
ncbi:MAG: AgmX/PglI C-terminal domain-containing protein [Myxococcales bacterium]|nr:AgmX/PglI C-terminal domain-containing protein [Myxococcales bacterium]